MNVAPSVIAAVGETVNTGVVHADPPAVERWQSKFETNASLPPLDAVLYAPVVVR